MIWAGAHMSPVYRTCPVAWSLSNVTWLEWLKPNGWQFKFGLSCWASAVQTFSDAFLSLDLLHQCIHIPKSQAALLRELMQFRQYLPSSHASVFLQRQGLRSIQNSMLRLLTINFFGNTRAGSTPRENELNSAFGQYSGILHGNLNYNHPQFCLDQSLLFPCHSTSNNYFPVDYQRCRTFCSAQSLRCSPASIANTGCVLRESMAVG